MTSKNRQDYGDEDFEGQMKKLKEEQLFLSENLLQALLVLDGIHSDNPVVKARRKAGVKEIQQVLDRIDGQIRLVMEMANSL
jgi:hypothetical protein